MNDLTARLNEQSIESVRKEISKKTSHRPYFANSQTVDNSVTDMDHHPYTRWFRGVYYYPDPIIMEREAGWRVRQDQCYSLNIPYTPESDPQHCYEIPCSTTLPCYPKYLTKYADNDALNVMINHTCISQYR